MKQITVCGDKIDFTFLQTDKFKTNYISVNFIAPLSKETAYLNALLSKVLLRGTRNYINQAEINKRLQYLYSADIFTRNEKFGEYQIFGFCADMLNNRYTGDTDVTKETVNLLTEILFEPYLENGVFVKEYVESEKRALIDSINADVNNKVGYSVKRMTEEMCSGEVFGIYKKGTVEQIREVTPGQLFDYYQKVLEELRIEIYFVGSCDMKEVTEIIKSRFSTVQRSVRELPVAVRKDTVEKVKEICDTEEVSQGQLCLGFRTGYGTTEKDFTLAQLFSAVYGEGTTSKLFKIVREKMSLCYFCRSVVSHRSGIMTVYSGIEFKNKEIAEKAILDQLEDIKAGNVSDSELENAKKYLINDFKQISDSQLSLESWYMYRDISNVELSPEEAIEIIKKSDKEEIVKVAKDIKLDTVYFLKGESNG